ncbi:MAG: hypothetical protein BroJett029_25020 [Alphaproteobacteria bacterium]|nr:MAG: hypothetical protein BroJett029_25020 [Alphaproteobacteria bacterium]
MAERPPPVPPAGRSKKVPGETERLPKELGPGKRREPRDTEKQGRQGNIKQNTKHQGYQQDR